jgi:hypothetical protein
MPAGVTMMVDLVKQINTFFELNNNNNKSFISSQMHIAIKVISL